MPGKQTQCPQSYRPLSLQRCRTVSYRSAGLRTGLPEVVLHRSDPRLPRKAFHFLRQWKIHAIREKTNHCWRHGILLATAAAPAGSTRTSRERAEISGWGGQRWAINTARSAARAHVQLTYAQTRAKFAFSLDTSPQGEMQTTVLASPPP